MYYLSFSAFISMPNFVAAVSNKFCTSFASSSSSPGIQSMLYWNGQLVCTPASTALFACMSGTVSRLYRHIRQAAIPARVVLGTATRRASRRPL